MKKIYLLFFSLFLYAGAQSQIPNSDFENWTPLFYLMQWQTNSCYPCVPAIDRYIVIKDSLMVYTGKYSAKLILNGGTGNIPPIAEAKFPVSTRPNSLIAYVKCNMLGVKTDSVYIKVKLFNGLTIVDSSQWLSDTTITQWTKLVIPIPNSGLITDSADITLTGGRFVRDSIEADHNFEFWVDDLSFDIPNGIPSTNNKPPFNLYNNPEDNEISVSGINRNSKKTKLKITDGLGREIYETSITSEQLTVYTGSFTNGIYFVTLINGNNIATRKIMVQHE